MRVESSKPKTRSKKTTNERLASLNDSFQSLEKEVAELDIADSVGKEALFLAEFERMLRYNSLLIRKLNKRLNDAGATLNSRDIYALSTLMSQQREVIADVRSITDMSQQAEMLVSGALTPFVSDTTQYVTDIYYQIRKLLRETTKPKDTQFALNHLDELVRQLGMGIQRSHEQARSKIVEVLLGEPAKPGKKRKS